MLRVHTSASISFSFCSRSSVMTTSSLVGSFLNMSSSSNNNSGYSSSCCGIGFTPSDQFAKYFDSTEQTSNNSNNCCSSSSSLPGTPNWEPSICVSTPDSVRQAIYNKHNNNNKKMKKKLHNNNNCNNNNPNNKSYNEIRRQQEREQEEWNQQQRPLQHQHQQSATSSWADNFFPRRFRREESSQQQRCYLHPSSNLVLYHPQRCNRTREELERIFERSSSSSSTSNNRIHALIYPCKDRFGDHSERVRDLCKKFNISESSSGIFCTCCGVKIEEHATKNDLKNIQTRVRFLRLKNAAYSFVSLAICGAIYLPIITLSVCAFALLFAAAYNYYFNKNSSASSTSTSSTLLHQQQQKKGGGGEEEQEEGEDGELLYALQEDPEEMKEEKEEKEDAMKVLEQIQSQIFALTEVKNENTNNRGSSNNNHNMNKAAKSSWKWSDYARATVASLFVLPVIFWEFLILWF